MTFTISFTGDLSMNGHYKQMALQDEDPFAEVAPLFKISDAVVINLEAVCVSPTGQRHSKGTTLSIAPSTLAFLKTINTSVACLANNHVYDNMEDGFRHTIEILKEQNIDYVGACPVDENNEPLVLSTNHKSIVLLNYVHELTHPGIHKEDNIHINLYNKAHIISNIKEYRNKGYYIVLILHWGQDNSKYPAPWQRKDAREFVKAGADLIIGHHAHVLQGFEQIGQATVFYGLGNFAFSPIRENEQLDQKRQTETIIIISTFKDGKISHQIIPIKLKGHIPVQISKSSIYQRSSAMKVISNQLIWPAYMFYLNIIYKFYFYFFGNNRNPLSQLKKINIQRLKRLVQIISNFKN